MVFFTYNYNNNKKNMNNRIKYFESDTVLEEFYKALADKNEKKLRRVHIPRSDVFYITPGKRIFSPGRDLSPNSYFGDLSS